MVKTLPSNAGGIGLIPGWGPKIPTYFTAKKPKHKTEAILSQIQERLKMGLHFFKKSILEKKACNHHGRLGAGWAAHSGFCFVTLDAYVGTG